ncbi:MAG: exodeoxyribonuclease VII small subunit [Bacteroidetes bacterium]|nr:MAG: exodeoxyribonuclease VII small subunit [Bacteroidota bacterium]
MEELNYQKAFEELQQIVKSMQEEMTSIDELTEQSKRAAFLINFCQEKLRKTEEEINSLFDSNE